MQTVIFDFDGTLMRGDSLFSFARRYLSPLRFATGMLRAAPKILAWKLGRCTSSDAKQQLFSCWYKGLPLSTFDSWSRDFAGYIDSHISPSVTRAFHDHIARGDQVYIISASMDNWIRPWAERQGNVRLIATKPSVSADNHLTGAFYGPNCLGSEKVRRLREDPCFNPGLPITVYTDSYRDAPLIQLSDNYIMVARDGNLKTNN